MSNSNTAARASGNARKSCGSAFLYGLRSILTPPGAEPDVVSRRAEFERDPAKRQMEILQRIGDSFRLAMGQPVESEVSFMGEKRRFTVYPSCADAAHLADLQKAREAVPGADEWLRNGEAEIQLTGEEAKRFLAMLRADGYRVE